jgi:hypothetical protein
MPDSLPGHLVCDVVRIPLTSRSEKVDTGGRQIGVDMARPAAERAS